MKCEAVQNTILRLPDPRRVPDALRAHVIACPGCRAWAEQVARLEALLEHLPVPPAPGDKKNALVAELTRGTAARRLAEPAAPAASFFRRNATLVGGLAAALLVAVGLWAFTGKNPVRPDVAGTPKDPFLDKVVKRDVALAKADTPAKKLRELGGLADDLAGQARSLARVASPDDLQELARMFDRVVKNGMLRQAEKITPLAMTPAELKAEFGELSGRLEAAAAEADRALAEAPPESKPALQRIADAARDGRKKLNDLATRKGV